MALIPESATTVPAVVEAQQPWYAGGTRTTASTRHDAQRFARELLSSTKYRQKLQSRLDDGDLPPAVETMLWHYAYGKPAEQVKLTLEPGQEDLSELSIEELQDRLEVLQKELQDARAVASAIPATYFVEP